jgi:hypothetical protein
MGIHIEIEMNLFVLVSLAEHEFKGSIDVFKRKLRAAIIYTYFNI